MQITNYSEIPHRYQEPGSGGVRYYWHPGQTVDVPPGVGRLMLQSHPAKFVDPNAPLATDGLVTSDLQEGDYVVEVPTTTRRRSGPRPKREDR